jgi:CheY-like chemotaxis protein
MVTTHMAEDRRSRGLVLIVDEDQAARDLYGDWFTSEGFEVMSAVVLVTAVTDSRALDAAKAIGVAAALPKFGDFDALRVWVFRPFSIEHGGPPSFGDVMVILQRDNRQSGVTVR